VLLQIHQGALDANFLEGMACPGGCVGGPGIMADHRLTGKLVGNFAAAAAVATAPENTAAAAGDIDLHRKKEH
jgi:Iron only hydrogenase large subunit, C-terminal domain